MSDLASVVLLFGGYMFVMRYLLPKMGVGT
jgi:hypothetical protein